MSDLVADRTVLVRQGRRLEYFTIGYNSLEGIASLMAGLFAGSIALVGFGFDSLIEVTSGVALLWRLSHDADAEGRERMERTTLRIVGICFFLLAAYILFDSSKSLIRHEAPEESKIGIVIMLLSLVIMPFLMRAKRRVGNQIQSRALLADAKQTALCTWLSAITLAGLLLNSLYDWWWADPIAALAMVPIIVREGLEGLRGERCCEDQSGR